MSDPYQLRQVKWAASARYAAVIAGRWRRNPMTGDITATYTPDELAICVQVAQVLKEEVEAYEERTRNQAGN